MGFMISFAGNVTYPKMQHLRDVAREFRSIVCSPKPTRRFCRRKAGAENETSRPCGRGSESLGECERLSRDEMAAITAANFRRFFGLERGIGGGYGLRRRRRMSDAFDQASIFRAHDSVG